MNKEKALSYLYEHGRVLDQRVYELHFGDGTVEAVLEAIAPFQNADGGFGHGMEPDIRTAASSAIATSTAFGMLRDVKAPSSSPVVQKAIQYYLDTFDSEKQVWAIVPPEVEDAPRAFWWDYAKSEESFGRFLHNPRAAILGHLWAYADLVPSDFLTQLTEIQLTALEALTSDNVDMFDIDCYVGLASAPIPEAARARLNAVIEPVIRKQVTLAADAELTEMSLVPLRVAPSPDAPFAHLFDDALLQANLKADWTSQLDDGSWELGWDWSAIDAAAWEQAKRDWKGFVIVHKLKSFESFGV